VLILDDPTASLDAGSEYMGAPAFCQTHRGLYNGTCVSHHFSTVRIAQRVLVLDDGQIREQGTHELGGRYAEFFNVQTEGYR
jgi:ATP-binding cassette subfamily B protein